MVCPYCRRLAPLGSGLFKLIGNSAGSTAASNLHANSQWPTYGADLASTRYSPLDQINKDNFSKLQLVWRLNTNNLGPTADRLYAPTPLMVDGVLYSTAGTARSGVALNPGTGQILWMYQMFFVIFVAS